MLTAAAIAIAASMVYIFAEHKTPMTNGIHNKRFQGLTLGWSQQYFSHILLTHKGLSGTTKWIYKGLITSSYLTKAQQHGYFMLTTNSSIHLSMRLSYNVQL